MSDPSAADPRAAVAALRSHPESDVVMTEGYVYLALADPRLRERLAVEILERGMWQVRSFDGCAAWRAAAPRLEPGCVLLDLEEPGGVEALGALHRAGMPHAAVMLDGQGDVTATVGAMKLGAVDVVERPPLWARLAPAFAAAFRQLRERAERRSREDHAAALVGRLSPRERDVMMGMIAGLPNKLIAQRLSLSPRTVEAHRASLFAKMEISNLVDLVKCAMAAGLLEVA